MKLPGFGFYPEERRNYPQRSVAAQILGYVGPNGELTAMMKQMGAVPKEKAGVASAMNDVTSRNGIATQTLEDQLSIFNTKTTRALEDLGSLSSQFESHGKALVEVAS